MYFFGSLTSWNKRVLVLGTFSSIVICVVSLRSRKDMPLSFPPECRRDCTQANSPKQCYYHFHLEQYSTLTKACDFCSKNKTNDCQCILADGVERSMFTVNRVLPGPSIEVCEGDQVIIDVANHIHAVDITIHWHGILQRDTPHYDGVPFVTQCPIFPGTTFRYNWTALNPGTYFWHGHTGFLEVDGIAGSIIIRPMLRNVKKNHLYDYDLSDHIIFLQDWLHELMSERFPGRRFSRVGQEPDNILINGKGYFQNRLTGEQTNVPIESFVVASGSKYRFRLINAFATVCPCQIFIENHNLTIIAMDGESVQPVPVSSIISASGERYDFVIHANQEPRNYWVQVKGLGECEKMKIQQLAILKYKDSSVTNSNPPTYDNGLPAGKVLNPLDGICKKVRPDAICVNQFINSKRVDTDILRLNPDLKITVPFNFYIYNISDVFVPNTFKPFFVAIFGEHLLGMMDNISYTAPSSPLISQYNDINSSSICNRQQKLTNCKSPCICTHLIKIPLNVVVDVFIIENSTFNDHLNHPFHLHGFPFLVMGIGKLSDLDQNVSIEDAIELNNKDVIMSRLGDPPAKDTIIVPNQGFAAIRFKALIPGFWLFHCHFIIHMVTGMSMVLQIGNLTDMPPIPDNFPKCGNFIP